MYHVFVNKKIHMVFTKLIYRIKILFLVVQVLEFFKTDFFFS